MHFPLSLVSALLAAVICQVGAVDEVIRLYGDTVEVPCNDGAANPNAFMTKWKYEKGASSENLLVKMKDENATITATDGYKERVSLGSNLGLLIADATLDDQKIFTCMVVDGADIKEYPVQLVINKPPSWVEISEKAEDLEIGKLTKLGTCTAQDAHPAATVTWFKNKTPLEADGKGIVITASTTVDATSGLSTTSSTLEYTAEKDDMTSQFSCGTKHPAGADLKTEPETFTVIYPTEKVSLQVIYEEPLTEGDNVTLRCKADGNPPPTSFNFHVMGEVIKVENSDTYILTDVTRDSTGEYKCSLIDNPKMVASENITVNYLNMTLSPSGQVTKLFGGSLAYALQTDAPGEVRVSWTKDSVKLDNAPSLDQLTYSDSGLYECEVTLGALVQRSSFELIVEGAPVIRKLTKHLGEDGQHKVLVCEADGFPKPAVTWSINGTVPEESAHVDGRISHKLTVVPTANLTVYCTVSNSLGVVSSSINVSSLMVDQGVEEVEEVMMDKQDGSDNDQTKVVVGVVVGLLLATVVIGLAYFLYMRKSKQGSWKTGEKEDGSSEEEKKLEENLEKIDETREAEESPEKAEV